MTDWRNRPWRRVEQIGQCTLYLGDNTAILPHLEPVDLLLTDPPYGIGADEAAAKNKGKWGWVDYGESQWDRQRPPKEAFDLMLSKSKEQVIWGGNYFTDYVPPRMRWLMWDKGQRDFSLADFEMAWTSQDKAARAFDYPRALALKDGKQHPTQKPIELMKWCLDFFPKAETVLDCYLGSGTTGVACVKLGRKFIGIEIDEGYFDIACKRIEEAYKQPDMFITQPSEKPTQEALFE